METIHAKQNDLANGEHDDDDDDDTNWEGEGEYEAERRYSFGEIPLTMCHAEVNVLVNLEFEEIKLKPLRVWCIYLKSGRANPSDIPALHFDESEDAKRVSLDIPNPICVVGDFNTTTNGARRATIEKFVRRDVGWTFPNTTKKRRSILQCQLDKLSFESSENDKQLFSDKMMNSALMTTGYYNKRGKFIRAGLKQNVADTGCKDYIILYDNRIYERDLTRVIIYGKDKIWIHWDSEYEVNFLPTEYHWSDHAAVIRDIEIGRETSKNGSRPSDRAETKSIRIATLNMASDQGSLFEWYDANLIPLYEAVAALLEKPVSFFLQFCDGMLVDSIIEMLESKLSECSEQESTKKFCFDPRGEDSVMQLMIMECSSSDKKIIMRPCLKNCGTRDCLTGNNPLLGFVRSVAGFQRKDKSGNMTDDKEDDWWHADFFRLWQLPKEEIEAGRKMSLSDHILRLFDFITMTALFTLGKQYYMEQSDTTDIAKIQKCLITVDTILSKRPPSDEYKCEALLNLFSQRHVHILCLTDVTKDFLLKFEEISFSFEISAHVEVLEANFNSSGHHGVAILKNKQIKIE